MEGLEDVGAFLIFDRCEIRTGCKALSQYKLPTEECWCEGPEQDENHKDEKMENNAFYFMTKLG